MCLPDEWNHKTPHAQLKRKHKCDLTIRLAQSRAKPPRTPTIDGLFEPSSSTKCAGCRAGASERVSARHWLNFVPCPDQFYFLSLSATGAYAARSPTISHVRVHVHNFVCHHRPHHSISRRVQSKAQCPSTVLTIWFFQRVSDSFSFCLLTMPQPTVMQGSLTQHAPHSMPPRPSIPHGYLCPHVLRRLIRTIHCPDHCRASPRGAPQTITHPAPRT